MGTGNFYYQNILGVISPDAEHDELYSEQIRFAEDAVLERLENEYKDKQTILVVGDDHALSDSRVSRNFGGRVFGRVVVEPWDDAVVEILLVTYSGYYSHANIDYLIRSENFGERSEYSLFEHPSVVKAVRVVEEAIRSATVEQGVSARFSSGETWYEKKEGGR